MQINYINQNQQSFNGMKIKRNVPKEIRSILENSEMLKKESQKFDLVFYFKKGKRERMQFGYKLFCKAKEIGENAHKKGRLVINMVFGDIANIEGFKKKEAIPSVVTDVKKALKRMGNEPFTKYFDWYNTTAKMYDEQVEKAFSHKSV